MLVDYTGRMSIKQATEDNKNDGEVGTKKSVKSRLGTMDRRRIDDEWTMKRRLMENKETVEKR